MQVESYFGRGGPCRNSEVEVFDENGEIAASGRTDEEGLWRFTPGKRENLRVVVTAGEGHRGEYTIPAEELPGGGEQRDVESSAEEVPAITIPTKNIPAHPDAGIVLSTSEIERIVDRLLDEKLAPIHRSLARAEIDEPGIAEVLSGFGYILGVFGTAMYFLSRSSKRE
jgi:nickel transport protein